MSIILYSTGCPKCAQLRALLDNHGVAYTINNSVDEMLEHGFNTVPVLAVDGSYMSYNEATKWVINTYKEQTNEVE